MRTALILLCLAFLISCGASEKAPQADYGTFEVVRIDTATRYKGDLYWYTFFDQEHRVSYLISSFTGDLFYKGQRIHGIIRK